MTDPDERLRQRLEALSAGYGARLAERLAVLQAVSAAAVTDPEARSELRRLAHQLKGSGRTFGFPAVSEAAAALERTVRELPAEDVLDEAQQAEIRRHLAALGAAVPGP